MRQGPMTSDNQAMRAREKTKSARGNKKPYQKPSFRHEKVFETLALACGKMAGTSAQCQSQQKSS